MAASRKWYSMMDDMLRPKHHINPQAQCDSPKDAAAVSPQEKAQGIAGPVCEEEDTHQSEAHGNRAAGLAGGYGEER